MHKKLRFDINPILEYILVMDKKRRYIIKSDERGHRKKLSEKEKTVSFSVVMTESMRDWCKIAGQKNLRSILENCRTNGLHL
jgi:hypothetical protein